MIKRNWRVGVFVDVANTHICTTSVWRDKKVDYNKLLEWAVGDHTLVRAIVYAVKHVDPNNPMAEKKMDKWAEAIHMMGYEVKMKEPTRYANSSKADWDITMAIDIVRMIDMVDLVVLVSGDGDFEEVVRYCQERGRLVRVIGVNSSTSHKLKSQANIYTPVSEHILMGAPRRDVEVSSDRR
ncbi:MAG: LabA-like NYN domain-containing protein [Candidatus Kariarchaeaceae archaeon]